jgi:hypothetical protein
MITGKTGKMLPEFMILRTVAAAAMAIFPSLSTAGPTSYSCEIEGFKISPAEGSEQLEWVGMNAMKTTVGIDRMSGRVIHPSIGNTSFNEIKLLNSGSSDWSFKVVADDGNGGWVRYHEVKEYWLGLDKPFLAVAEGILYWGSCR